MPKYLLLIVESESAYAEAGRGGVRRSDGAHNAFAAEAVDGRRRRPSSAARRCSPRRPPPTCAGPGPPDVHAVDNPMPEAQGGRRRLLPDRGRRRRGRAGARQAVPGRRTATSSCARSGSSAADASADRAVAEVAARAQRELSGRVLAVTLRSVRDLDIAEEATADAFLLALQTWPDRGVPGSVEAWLVTAARRRAIDRIRRRRPPGGR